MYIYINIYIIPIYSLYGGICKIRVYFYLRICKGKKKNNTLNLQIVFFAMLNF